MKNLNLLLILCFFPFTQLLAQSPQAMKYQTVVRNSAGEPIANSDVSLQLTILENGGNVYQESHDETTNAFGLINVNIGEGDSSDDLSDVSWDQGSYDLEIAIDLNGGSNYETIGTSPLLSVPFAFMAQTAMDVDDADADAENELQTLSIQGNTLTISEGNSVTLPTGESTEVDEDKLAKVWASVDILGNSNAAFDSHNIVSSSKISTGVYLITFNPGTFSVATNPAMICTVHNDLAPGVAIPTYGGGPSQVTVRTYSMNGTLSDRGFNLVVFGK
jgi:hypothetical protein